MKRLATIAAITMLSAAAQAQQAPPAAGPEYTLTVTGAELAAIGDALSTQPFKTVNPIIQKLNAQIQQQEATRQKKDQEKAPGQGDEGKPPVAPPAPSTPPASK